MTLSKIRVPRDLLNPKQECSCVCRMYSFKGVLGGRMDHLHSLQLFQTSGHRVVDIDDGYISEWACKWSSWTGTLSLPNCL